jgi:hypothetical protein
MNQIVWKCHKETPRVAIVNKQKCHFFFLSFAKSENRRVEQVLPGGRLGGWYQWEGRGGGERVWDGEHNGNTVYK